jgi:hypothetical protein
MELADVKFIYAYPLDASRRKIFAERDPGKYPSIEAVQDQVAHWREVWLEINGQTRMLNAISEISKSAPSRSLECFCIGGGIAPMSTPLIMSATNSDWTLRSDNEFIDTLIHELLHIFIENNDAYFEKVNEKYPAAPVTTKNHILIFAMLEKLYEELFERVSIDVTRNYKSEEYALALDIVNREGADALLEEYYKFV